MSSFLKYALGLGLGNASSVGLQSYRCSVFNIFYLILLIFYYMLDLFLYFPSSIETDFFSYSFSFTFEKGLLGCNSSFGISLFPFSSDDFILFKSMPWSLWPKLFKSSLQMIGLSTVFSLSFSVKMIGVKGSGTYIGVLSFFKEWALTCLEVEISLTAGTFLSWKSHFIPRDSEYFCNCCKKPGLGLIWVSWWLLFDVYVEVRKWLVKGYTCICEEGKLWQ